MEDKQLVEEILNRVLQKLNSGQMKEEAIPDKPKLLILTEEHGTRCHEILENSGLLKKYHTECALAMNYECRTEEYDAVILFQLSNAVLGKLANGISDSPYLSLAMKAILSGKRIFCLREEVELFSYEASAPNPYYTMMSEKIDFLTSCGVIFCNKEQLESLIQNQAEAGKAAKEEAKEPVRKEASCGQKAVTLEKKVVTEKDVERAYAEGAKIICISEKAILSDLAKEYAGNRKIELKRSRL